MNKARESLQKSRTEITTALNFFRSTMQFQQQLQQQQAMQFGQQQNQNPANPNQTLDAKSAEDKLDLVGKKAKIETMMSRFPSYLKEIATIRNLAVNLGNRARQAEAIRKKQELKEAQKRRNERRARWNKQLIQDLGRRCF